MAKTRGARTPSNPRRSAPIVMTQGEVEAAQRGGKSAEIVARRLRSEVPSGPLGTVRSDKLTPPRITEDELSAIRKSGKVTKEIRTRMERAASRDPGRVNPIQKKEEPELRLPPKNRGK